MSVETPEGPNIGLITSLASYARVNDFGFIESPYRKVTNGKVTEKIDYLSAIDGENYVIAQATSPMDDKGNLTSETVSARVGGDFKLVIPEGCAVYGRVTEADCECVCVSHPVS